MNVENWGILIPILGILGTIVLPVIAVGYIAYIFITTRNKERLAMIEKGVVLPEKEKTSNPMAHLRNGFILIGLALGALLGVFLYKTICIQAGISERWAPIIVIAFIALIGGVGFLFSFFISQKIKDKKED